MTPAVKNTLYLVAVLVVMCVAFCALSWVTGVTGDLMWDRTRYR